MYEYEIIRHTQAGGLTVFFDTVDYRTAHIHPEWELLWVIDQPLDITCGARELRSQPDTLLLINPEQVHQFRKVDQSCTFLCLQISPKCFRMTFPEMDSIRLDSPLLEEHWNGEQGAEARKILMEVADAYFRRPDCYPLYCLGKAALLLHQVFACVPTRRIEPGALRDMERRNATLIRLIQYVDQNYAGKVLLSDFARQEGRSVSYLSRLVREELNQTFQSYVDSVRFFAACKLMAAGMKRMVDVYTASGFSDYRYFSRAFRQRTGQTPEEYSKTLTPDRMEQTHVHRSIHSLERFYSRERCVQMLDELRQRAGEGG